MKKSLVMFRVTAVIVALCAVLFAELSSDPDSAGMGNARSLYSGGIEAASTNPALLGAELGPWGGAGSCGRSGRRGGVRARRQGVTQM